MYLTLVITTVLYVLIAIGVFGTLTVQEVIDNGETALAVAAKPALGEAGFAIMAVAALLATSSSVNANLYAAAGTTAKAGGVRHVPTGLRPARHGRRDPWTGDLGLLVLLLANLVDLTSIASLGSAVALVIFLVTSIVAYRLRAETGSQSWGDRCGHRTDGAGPRCLRGGNVADRPGDVHGDDRGPRAGDCL